MPLLTVILVIVAVGVLLWLINRFVPMQPTVKQILNGVVIIVLVIWLLKIFGVFSYFTGVHV